jgi:hypothetical protein
MAHPPPPLRRRGMSAGPESKVEALRRWKKM